MLGRSSGFLFGAIFGLLSGVMFAKDIFGPTGCRNAFLIPFIPQKIQKWIPKKMPCLKVSDLFQGPWFWGPKTPFVFGVTSKELAPHQKKSLHVSRDHWVYPYQRTSMGNPYISPENKINTVGTLLGVRAIVPCMFIPIGSTSTYMLLIIMEKVGKIYQSHELCGTLFIYKVHDHHQL